MNRPIVYAFRTLPRVSRAMYNQLDSLAGAVRKSKMSYQTILVVDDEPQIVEIVGDYLRQAGYRVLTARDGQTALTLSRHERPDLIVLDLMMPGGMDGLDVCRRLRQDPVLQDIRP